MSKHIPNNIFQNVIHLTRTTFIRCGDRQKPRTTFKQMITTWMREKVQLLCPSLINSEKKNWMKKQREKPGSQIGKSSGKPWPFWLNMRQYIYINYHLIKIHEYTDNVILTMSQKKSKLHIIKMRKTKFTLDIFVYFENISETKLIYF